MIWNLLIGLFVYVMYVYTCSSFSNRNYFALGWSDAALCSVHEGEPVVRKYIFETLEYTCMDTLLQENPLPLIGVLFTYSHKSNYIKTLIHRNIYCRYTVYTISLH